ncbi:hypothetical protein G8759_18615 [Spirosoma aureum]|uniref:Uncharacterized protein n=1 Tax=Spirosoma aureum TaxID=2692134 RepID=A0A6G9AQD3_9BACT|nr:hypothetical protein [Spirosoma aureum]QIP14485.1 hypothetical protein G8759_18615 [Spirosoma aureum]
MVKFFSRFWVKQFVYLITSGLVVLFILLLPENSAWLNGPIQHFYDQHQKLGQKTDRQSRERAAYGNAYTYTMLIKQQCKPTDYFLIPPQRYLIRNAYRQGAADGFVWIYPSVLYYHLGKAVHLLEMTGPDTLLQRATHTLWVQNNRVILFALSSQNRLSVLSEFRKYDPRFFAYTPSQARQYYYSRK